MKSWKNLYLQGSFHPSALLVWGTGLCMHCHHSSAQALWSGRAFCPFFVHPSYFSGTQRQAPVCSQCLAKVAAVSKKRWEKKKNKQLTQTGKIKNPKCLKTKALKFGHKYGEPMELEGEEIGGPDSWKEIYSQSLQDAWGSNFLWYKQMAVKCTSKLLNDCL